MKDSYVNGKDVNIKGNSKLVKGKFGKVLKFNDTSNYVNVPVNLNECKEITEVILTNTRVHPPGE